MCQQVLMGAELALWFAFVWRWWVMEFDASLGELSKVVEFSFFFIARISIQNKPFHCHSHDLWTVGLWKCMPPVDNPSTCLPLDLIPFRLFGATHLQHPPSIVRAHWWEQLITSHLCQLWLWSWALPVWQLSSFGMPELLPQMDGLYPANPSRTIITIGVTHFPLETKGLLIRNSFTWLSEGQYTTYISFLKGHDFLNLQMLTLSLPVNRAF